MTLCGSRMLFQDIPFFYGWLSNKSSQLRIDFIGLEYMVPIDAHSVFATMKIITHLFFECSSTKAIWWHVCDRCDIPRMTKGWEEWIRWATVMWHGKSFVNFSRKLGFAAAVYYIWQERNARIFAGMSRTPNLVFDQIECIIREKLDLMRKALPTDENIRIQSAWRVNNI
jgi:hypothetical protein